MPEDENYKITIIPGPTWAQLVSKICQEAAQAGIIPPRTANDVILTTFAVLDAIYKVGEAHDAGKKDEDEPFDKVLFQLMTNAAMERVKKAMEQRKQSTLIVGATNADLNKLLDGRDT